MTITKQTSVLITGANKGLGLEAARRLGEQGWMIFLGSRDEGRGRAAADKLIAADSKVVVVPLDVTSDESVAEAIGLVRERTDRLDVLINNAGAPGKGVTPADATVDEIHAVYDVNVYGPIRVTHAFLRLLQASVCRRRSWFDGHLDVLQSSRRGTGGVRHSLNALLVSAGTI